MVWTYPDFFLIFFDIRFKIFFLLLGNTFTIGFKICKLFGKRKKTSIYSESRDGFFGYIYRPKNNSLNIVWPNMSIVRVDTLVSSLTYACVWMQRRWLEKEKRLCEWSRECSFAKCDVCFVGKCQAHSKLFNYFSLCSEIVTNALLANQTIFLLKYSCNYKRINRTFSVIHCMCCWDLQSGNFQLSPYLLWDTDKNISRTKVMVDYTLLCLHLMENMS